MVTTMNTAAGVEVRDGLFRRLWKDDCGALIGTEWMLVATIMVIGVIPGYIVIRQGALRGLTDFANATGSLDQSYSFCGQRLECPGHDRDSWSNRGKWTDVNRDGSKKANNGALNGRPVANGERNTDDGHRWGLAFTPGSRYVKPARPPLKLEPTPAQGTNNTEGAR
jgi:hypothetical protein